MSDKATVKDWIKFITYTAVIMVFGAMIGFTIGRNHPSVSAKQAWLGDLEAKMNTLQSYQHAVDEQYHYNIAVRDSIISELTRYVIKGDSVDLPIIVNVTFKEECYE